MENRTPNEMSKEAMALEIAKIFVELDADEKMLAADQIAERLGADHPIVLFLQKIAEKDR